MDNAISMQAGWLKTGAVLLSIAVLLIGAFNGLIFTKLSNIETLLHGNDKEIVQHTEQIKSLDCRVRDIEERNKYIDQQSGLLGTRRNDATPR